MVWDIFFFLGGGGSYEGKFVEIVDGVGNFFILVEFLCRILLIHYRLCNHLAIFERSDFLLPWSFVNSTTSSTILVSLLENPGPFGPMISLSVSHLRWRSGSGQNSKTFVMPPANPADPETQLRLGDLFQKKTRFLKARGWFLEWLKTLFHIVLYKSSKGSRWLMWFEIIQSNYWMERMRFAFRRWTFGPFCCQRSDFRSLRFGLLRWQQQTIVLSVLTFAETSLVVCIYSIVFIYWSKFPWHSEHKFLHSNLCLVCSHNSACRTGWLQAKAGLEGIRGRGPCWGWVSPRWLPGSTATSCGEWSPMCIYK